MPNLCNVDGRVLPEGEAVVPVTDRGFLFGDSVYEVFRTRHGVPFAWREHLQRLRTSARAIAMTVDLDDADLMSRVVGTVIRSRTTPADERYVRLIVTRGSGTAPSIDLDSAIGVLRVVVIVRELVAAKIGRPARAIVVPRHAAPGREADPAVKSGNYVTNIVGLAEARRNGADECIFADDAGFVTEASTANLFAVFDGEVHTPPIGAGLLAGITRSLLLECARAAGVGVVERRIPRVELAGAQELFLSGTVRDLAPVVELDGRPVGYGAHAPVTERLKAAFGAFCELRARDDAHALAALGIDAKAASHA